jgi:hopanoid biosynthesis associated RND transporter like protein HpnN
MIDVATAPRRRDARGPDRGLVSPIRRTVIACAAHAVPVAVVAALLFAAALAYVVTHFAIDTDAAKLISADVPWRQRELAFTKAFPQRSDLIAVVVDAATPEQAERAAAELAKRLERDHERLRAVSRPDAGPFFEREGLLFEPTQVIGETTQRLIAAQPLLGTLAADPSLRGLMDALSLMATGATQEPAALDALAKPLDALADAFDAIVAGGTPAFSWHTLFTGQAPDARLLRRFILVQPVLDYTALRPGERASDAIREAARSLDVAPGATVRVRLTGPVPLADEEFSTIAEGAGVNTLVTLAAVVALLWIALRSWRLIVAILASLCIGLVVTAAFGLVAFGAYNLISVAFAILFVGLGVDFGIQFAMAYRARRRATGDSWQALHDIGGEVGAALALAAAATAAGFYSFVPTDYRGVSELGVVAGTGMIVAFVSSITVLPALVALLRPRGERAEVGYRALAPLDRWLLAHRPVVIAVATLVALAGAALVPKLRFDFDPMHLRSPRAESVATLADLAKDPTTAPDTIDVLAPSVADAARLGEKLEKLPVVDHVVSLASFVPEDQDEKLALIGDAAMLLEPTLAPSSAKPPPTDAETVTAMSRAAQSLDATRAAGAESPFGKAASRLAVALRALAGAPEATRERARRLLVPALQTTLDQLRAALSAEPVTLATLPEALKRDWLSADGRARVEVYPKGDVSNNVALRRFVDAVLAVAPDATGAPVSIEASSRTVVDAFAKAGVLAFVSITLLLVATLRRARDVALTLAPLVLAALGTLGTCVLIDRPMNFENIIALPLLFGIGVAFNIYFVMAWRAGRPNPLQSSLTRAVVMSGLTTGTAFGSLWLSHHPGTASMGELLALSLAWTLLSALLFLPALLGAPR